MNKLGAHIIGGFSGSLGRPTIVKLFECSPEYVRQVRGQVGERCLIIVRRYVASQDLSAPVDAARRWFSLYEPYIMGCARGDSNIAFEGYNEIPDALADAYCTFEVERLRLMHQAGYRSVVGNFSVGCPDIPVWAKYVPMLKAMSPLDLLGLHEYWADEADIANRWHCGRWQLVPTLSAFNLAIVVTECGRDVVEGKGKPGWRATCNSEQFLRDLRAYDDLISCFGFVKGAVVFALGQLNGQWLAFDSNDIWPAVVASYPTTPTIPPDVPPETPEPSSDRAEVYRQALQEAQEALEQARAVIQQALEV